MMIRFVRSEVNRYMSDVRIMLVHRHNQLLREYSNLPRWRLIKRFMLKQRIEAWHDAAVAVEGSIKALETQTD